MNDMMDMNGNLMSMGMKMSNQTMDMNSVMYPEVTGASPNPSKGGEKIPHHMTEMNMEQENVDMVTLNYAMLKSPFKVRLLKVCVWKPLKSGRMVLVKLNAYATFSVHGTLKSANSAGLFLM